MSARPTAAGQTPGAPAAPDPTAPPTLAAAYAAYEAKEWTRCTDLFLAVASVREADAVEAFYSAACCLALAGTTERAFEILDKAVVAGWSNVEHMQRDADLTSLRGDARWSKIVDATRANADAEEKAFGEPALRRELLAMLAEDQVARNAWIANQTDVAAQERVRQSDRTSTAHMKQIIARHGWPGHKLVGNDGAHAAWLLVQHADADRSFQKLCLDKLEAAVAAGDASGTDLAYLHDRVAIAENRKQRYGTQFSDGGPMPIEDEANVDARRAAVGLDTLAEYQREIEAMYGKKDAAKAEAKDGAPR